MCGISALVDYSHPIPPSVLQTFNRALIHRGPDNQTEMLLADGRAGLGHCRLSIVDTSEHANQPFVSQDKRYVLVFNGEIYNYVELRTELEANGVIFRTGSDTEVLLHAFEMWQEDCLQRFNGMWAFVIWDNHTRRLFMSRDRFGVKPLYFRLDKHGIAVASEQKAFAAHPGGLVIDPQQAARFALCPEAVESTSDTLYQHVQKLLPGEYAWFSEQGVSRHRWWHTYTEIKNLPRPACREELLGLFQDACQVRTRTDVNIAVALSGGLDSSAVTGTLCTLPDIQRDKKLTAFVGSFPDTPQDEYKWAKMVTDHYRLPSHRVAVDPSRMANSLVTSTRSLEDVNALPVVGQWHVYQGMRDAGFKVSIEGHGGDELLAGYYRHLSVYAAIYCVRDGIRLSWLIR
ncbi:asparagine synthase (glutamine-hydrolyzing) [Pseudobowmanella zhangzhouensis]|uniref:asparagine synthase (glutamine-hydrolyzing) n=1 Tax=Pseudobowmanella zhangzhouensis TaxID=1537679 RepID=UPI003607DE5E